MNVNRIAHDLLAGTLAFAVILGGSLLVRATFVKGTKEPVELGLSSFETGVACGLSDDGWMVGFQKTAHGTRGALWTGQNAAPVFLNAFHALADVNECGQVAGTLLAGDVFCAGVADVASGLFLIDPGGISSCAYGINNRGQVVGAYWNHAGQATAFCWTEETGVVDLVSLGGRSASFAKGINDRGDIVGQLAPAEGSQAFIYNPISDLLALDAGGAAFSCANDVNNRGVVVGHFEFKGKTHACFWGSAGTLVDLNSLLPAGSRWELLSAWAINDSGQVLGYGTKDGREVDFLLKLDAEG